MTMTENARNAIESPPATQKQPERKAKSADPMSRIKLALLDQYTKLNEAHGGDPYNTTKGSKKQDQWRGNARRI